MAQHSVIEARTGTARQARLLTAVAAIALFVCTNGPVFFAWRLAGRQQGNWDEARVAVPFAVIAVFGVVALAAQGRRSLSWPLVPVGAFAGLSIASALWSPLPGTTLQRALIYGGLAAFSVWLARLPLEVQMTAVGWAMGAAVVASALVVAVEPGTGRMVRYDGAIIGWKGIFTNRNSLAPVCALGVLAVIGVCASRWRAARRLPAGWLALGVFELFVLHQTQSDTARAALAIALVLAAALVLIAPRVGARAAAIVAGTVGCLIAFVAVFRPDAVISGIAALARRSSTLSSRTIIWEDAVDAIGNHVVLGHGFWTFWEVPAYTASTYARIGIAYGEAHNSLLEVALGLGVVGAALLLAIVGAALVGNAGRYWRRPSVDAWWWTAVTLFLVLINVTESFVLWFSYSWVLLVAAAVASTRRDRVAADSGAAGLCEHEPRGHHQRPPDVPAGGATGRRRLLEDADDRTPGTRRGR